MHVPEGATPKDGPSAGVAMVTAIISVLTGIPVRKDVAMTGEITLRGRVLPIGGLKEKLLAALRGGIKTVIIPEENVKDLAEIPAEIKNKIEIVPVARVDDVLKMALVRMPEAITWDEAAEAAAVKPKKERRAGRASRRINARRGEIDAGFMNKIAPAQALRRGFFVLIVSIFPSFSGKYGHFPLDGGRHWALLPVMRGRICPAARAFRPELNPISPQRTDTR